MSTKNEVIEAIKAIEDKGNNTAAEMRDVLTKLLDYSSTGYKAFHFWTEKESIIDLEKTAKLLYSFKGVENQTVDFTFDLTAKPKFDTFIFDIPEKLYATLQKIASNIHRISFNVPLIIGVDVEKIEKIIKEIKKKAKKTNNNIAMLEMVLQYIKKRGSKLDFFAIIRLSLNENNKLILSIENINLLKNIAEYLSFIKIATSIHFHIPSFNYNTENEVIIVAENDREKNLEEEILVKEKGIETKTKNPNIKMGIETELVTLLKDRFNLFKENPIKKTTKRKTTTRRKKTPIVKKTTKRKPTTRRKKTNK